MTALTESPVARAAAISAIAVSARGIGREGRLSGGAERGASDTTSGSSRARGQDDRFRSIDAPHPGSQRPHPLPPAKPYIASIAASSSASGRRSLGLASTCSQRITPSGPMRKYARFE